PLPVEEGDFVRRIAAPGWLAAGTRADGIVRVVNHGTDHGSLGLLGVDAPLYAKFGYSTATSPLLAGRSAEERPDQSVAIVVDGVAADRSGFTTDALELLACDDGSSAGWAVSTSITHRVTDRAEHPDHGTPWAGGIVESGPRVTTASLVRGTWEVRFVRVDRHDGDRLRGDGLRVSGWPVSGDHVRSDTSVGTATAVAAEVVSGIRSLAGFDASGVQADLDATFLGARTGTPWLMAPMPADTSWHIAAIGLARDALGSAPTAAFEGDGATVHVVWDDDAHISVTLPEAG
ncbi:MAG TPA: hypothetical protein VFE99_00865, partial [Agromyces sp.]|nr:hypothetical protein [Agromyces sp.]